MYDTENEGSSAGGMRASALLDLWTWRVVSRNVHVQKTIKPRSGLSGVCAH